MKKVISVLLSFVIVANMFVTVTIIASAYSVPDEAGFAEKLSSLKSQFPNGGYYSGTYYEKGTAKAWECHGYALECFEQVFGIQYYNDGFYNKRIFTTGTIYAGDIVRTGNDSHTIFITKVEGDRIYYTDANYWPAKYGANYVRWDESYTYSELQAVFTYKVHVPENYLTGNSNPTPNFTPADIGTDFYASIENTKAINPIITSGNNVVLGEMSGENNQIWKFERQSDISYKIINVATGTCLDDENYGTANDTNIQVCPSNDSSAQRWFLKVVGSGYSLVPKCALNSCIDVQGGVLSSGRNIQLFQQNDSDAQIFTISPRPSFNAVNKGDDFTAAIIFNATGSAVTAYDNDEVRVMSYTGSDNQLWRFERKSNRSYKITNIATGKCLDDENLGTSNGTNINICISNNSTAQRWFLKAVNDGFSLAPQCALNSCIDSYDGGTKDGTNIYLWTQNSSAAQIVSLKYVLTPDYETTYNGHNYKLYNKALPWREAYKFCEQQGGHLVTINSENEQSFLYNLINEKSTGSFLWLGATDSYEEGKWKWITGNSILYQNWADNEPNNSNDEDYMVLYKSSGKWNDGNDIFYSDTKAYSFICEFDNEVDDCNLEKSFDYNGHHYEVYSNTVDWQTAKRFCEQKGGHLITITSTNENNAVKNNVKGLTNERYWLGLTDISLESKWEWVTNEKTSFTDWAEGEPTNEDGIADYVELNTVTNHWYDCMGFLSANLNIGFICEYDSLPMIVLQNDMVIVSNVVTNSDATSVNPAVTVKVEGKTLTKNTDYTVDVSADIKNGIGTLTVTGKGNYIGTVTKNFTITINDTTVVNDFFGNKYETEQGEIITYYANLTSLIQVSHLNGIIYYNQEVLEPIIADDISYNVPSFESGHFQPMDSGQLRFDVYSSKSVSLNNIMVIRMQFRVIKKGGETWLGHQFETPEFTYENKDNYEIEAHILTDQVLYDSSKVIRGDVDGDGFVTIIDVTMIQRKLVQLPVYNFNEKAADIDGDGLDITDATRIQRYLAEFDDPYHIGEVITE